MFNPLHWLIAAVVILLVFGPKTLSKVAMKAGRAVRTATSFKRSLTDAPTKIIREVTSPAPSRNDKD